MSSHSTKELQVQYGENAKRIMYLAKVLLSNETEINLVSGTGASPVSTQAAETLSRLGYVTYGDIRTETNIYNGRRKTRLLITLKKTSNFQKLFDENEANRQRIQKEREGLTTPMNK